MELRELVSGEVRKRLRPSQAVAIVNGITPHSPVAQEKLELAHDLVADVRRIDAQRREVKRRITRAVVAAPTSGANRDLHVPPSRRVDSVRGGGFFVMPVSPRTIAWA
jgi:hypothetical protein